MRSIVRAALVSVARNTGVTLRLPRICFGGVVMLPRLVGVVLVVFSLLGLGILIYLWKKQE